MFLLLLLPQKLFLTKKLKIIDKSVSIGSSRKLTYFRHFHWPPIDAGL